MGDRYRSNHGPAIFASTAESPRLRTDGATHWDRRCVALHRPQAFARAAGLGARFRMPGYPHALRWQATTSALHQLTPLPRATSALRSVLRRVSPALAAPVRGVGNWPMVTHRSHRTSLPASQSPTAPVIALVSEHAPLEVRSRAGASIHAAIGEAVEILSTLPRPRRRSASIFWPRAARRSTRCHLPIDCAVRISAAVILARFAASNSAREVHGQFSLLCARRTSGSFAPRFAHSAQRRETLRN